MPIDRTDQVALNQLKQKYGDQIIGCEFKSWKESYLTPPPPRSFCQGITRYRNCFKVTHVKLKDGSKVVVGGIFHGNVVGGNNYQNDNTGIGCLIFILVFIFFIIIICR